MFIYKAVNTTGDVTLAARPPLAQHSLETRKSVNLAANNSAGGSRGSEAGIEADLPDVTADYRGNNQELPTFLSG